MKSMMIIFFSFLMALSVWGQDNNIPEKRVFTDKSSKYSVVKNTSFLLGEELNYKATFGWFTVGKAWMKVNTEIENHNNRPAFKVDAYGKTTGFVDWVVNVDDYWGALIDTASMVSHQGTRILKEGKYRKHEITNFYHKKDSLTVEAYSYKRSKWTEPEPFDAPNDVRDMLSGYFYVRNIDFTKKNVGDTIHVKAFLEDTFYDLSVVYGGKEKIKTKAGTFRALKILPIMPKNSIFDGADSVVSWLSDDENKIPLKVSAKMFIGHAGVELTGFKNLRHKPNIVK